MNFFTAGVAGSLSQLTGSAGKLFADLTMDKKHQKVLNEDNILSKTTVLLTIIT